MMRSLTVELFKLIYSVSGALQISYYAAVFGISVLDVFILQGVLLLLVDMFPTKMMLFLFNPPIVFGTGTLLFFANLLMANKKMLEIVDAIKTKYTKLIVYSGVAILLLVYSSLIGRLF